MDLHRVKDSFFFPLKNFIFNDIILFFKHSDAKELVPGQKDDYSQASRERCCFLPPCLLSRPPLDHLPLASIEKFFATNTSQPAGLVLDCSKQP
jgi:hypothetical protein